MSQIGKPNDEALRSWHPTGIKPRSVYIHIPFCRHRCGYCNFSLVANRDYLVDRFLNAIEIEIGWLDQSYELETLFLGGGTPSHLSPENLLRLKSIIGSRFILTPEAEVTAECNPNDLTDEKASALNEFGVNRISLGVQSLNAEKLKRLERDHDFDDVVSAMKIAKSFARSVSMDLIFAAPAETLAHWQDDVRDAISLDPDHVSTYELTYEKGTSFWNRKLRGQLAESDEDLRADMYLSATESLTAAGLEPYEISSFAKTGHRCRHNEIYWSGQPYFAFGPGASRYVDGIRETNHQSTMQYLKRIESGESATAFTEKLDAADSARELLAVGLRRADGVEEAAFLELTGYSVSQLMGEKVEIWIPAGLIIHGENSWRLTLKGRMMCDQIAGEILEA